MSNIFRSVKIDLDEERIRMMNSLSLAHVGDGVFELFVRTQLNDGRANAHKLHLLSSRVVKASSQAKYLSKIESILNDEELGVVNRAKNSKLHTIPKNATLKDYRYATAFEALFGYLYLMGRDDRLMEIYNYIGIGDKDEG